MIRHATVSCLCATIGKISPICQRRSRPTADRSPSTCRERSSLRRCHLDATEEVTQTSNDFFSSYRPLSRLPRVQTRTDPFPRWRKPSGSLIRSRAMRGFPAPRWCMPQRGQLASSTSSSPPPAHGSTSIVGRPATVVAVYARGCDSFFPVTLFGRIDDRM